MAQDAWDNPQKDTPASSDAGDHGDQHSHGHSHSHGQGHEQGHDGHSHSHGHGHSHGHSHGKGLLEHEHDHDPLPYEEMDPGQQSLADALRFAFWILKGAMAVLVVLYLFSGVFSVAEQEAAVRLRFGEIVTVDEQGSKILPKGGPYFAWPYPIEQVVRVPTSSRQVAVDSAFWYQVLDNARGAVDVPGLPPGRQGPLNPEMDGALLTGDANIVHVRVDVTYSIVDPVSFISHIAEPTRDTRAVAMAAEQIVQAAVERGLVHAMARTSVDDVLLRAVSATPGSQRAGQAIGTSALIGPCQQVLDDLDAGINLGRVNLTLVTVPLSVRDAFLQVNQAESDRAQLIEEATTERSKRLNEAAGAAAEGLWQLIQQYELARGDEAEQILTTLDDAFLNLRLPEAMGAMPVGGEAAGLINEGISYRTEVVEQVRSEANRVQQLLPQYQSRPGIVVNRLWQDVKQQVIEDAEEVFYLPHKGQLYLEFGRDPNVAKQRERQRLEAERTGAMQPGGGGP